MRSFLQLQLAHPQLGPRNATWRRPWAWNREALRLANMVYREPWDTVDNADSQMARYPRNRDGKQARAFISPSPIYQ